MRFISNPTILLSLLYVTIPGTYSWQNGGGNVLPLFSHRIVQTRLGSSTTLSVSSVESDVNQPPTSTKHPDMIAYSNGYTTLFSEQPSRICTPSLGQLPPDLIGTYFRSGPAMFSAGSLPPPPNSLVKPKSDPVPDGTDPDRMVRHPFEGDGGVLAVTFPGGTNNTATSRFRYVRTAGFTKERKRGQKLYTAMESTRTSSSSGQENDLPIPLWKHHLQPGLNKNRKNTSNMRAVYWAKKLLTLWEGGLPYKLDSLALSTEGKSQLGGTLQEDTPFGSKAVLDSNKDRMVFYANRQDAGSSLLTVYEFNSKFRLVGGEPTERKLPGLAVLADFGVSENYVVFVQPPVKVNGVQFVMSKDPGKTLSLEENGTAMLHLIPRVGTTGEMKTISIPPDDHTDADLHVCNSFEENDGTTLILDVIRSSKQPPNTNDKPLSWPWGTTLDEYQSIATPKSLWRYRIDITTGSITRNRTSDLQASFGIVNPAMSGRKHRFVYANVGALGAEVAPPQGIAKFDIESETTEVWFPKEYEFCGEPAYAPRADSSSEDVGEDDGYIVSVLFNGKTKESEMIVLNAGEVAAGPVARVPLGIAVPHGYFGCFACAEETGWSFEEIDRRARLADKMESRGSMWNEVKSDFSGLGLRLDDFEEYFGDIL